MNTSFLNLILSLVMVVIALPGGIHGKSEPELRPVYRPVGVPVQAPSGEELLKSDEAVNAGKEPGTGSEKQEKESFQYGLIIFINPEIMENTL